MENTLPPSAPAQPPACALRRRRAARVFPVLALGLFLLLGAAVYREGRPCFGWDLTVSHAVQALSWSGFGMVMRGVSEADNDALRASVLIAAACLVLAARRAWREAAVLLGVVLVGQGLWVVSGQVVGRPRPSPELVQVRIDPREIAGFPSFPSGHAAHYTAFFGFLCFLTLTKVRPPALRWPLLGLFAGMVLVVGLARVYLGAHWFSDVVGGYLLGAGVLATGIGLYRRWSP